MYDIIELIADITDGFVVVLLTGGMLFAIIRAGTSVFKLVRATPDATLKRTFYQLRIDLGQVLLLSLEILIISDILHSIVKRTFEEIGILAVIVAIRIALSYFLDHELAGLRKEMERDES